MSYKAINPCSKKYESLLTGTAGKMAKERVGKFGIQKVEKIWKQIEFSCQPGWLG
ncbi:MAG: hypothetical protein ACLQBD_18975 [Syntrophobacteraceae bacterium]